MSTLARTVLVVILGPVALLHAQDWSEPIRGSWVATAAEPGAVTLAEPGQICDLVVSSAENSAVRQAAAFLAGDIAALGGIRPAVVARPSPGHITIHLVTVGSENLPASVDSNRLRGKWEAYQIVAAGRELWLAGSDFRGTAFAAYTLSERLGVDPLYLWTGYRPERHSPLRMRAVNFQADPPVFRYRGLFHDDEDILPRPFENTGYPLRYGDVPTEWYKKYFETALRLRLNMVAPYTRVHRRLEVQQLASRWGLFYTSHHYDILLSNPFGFVHYGLGAQRHAGDTWDWSNNREGMLNYWRGGVEENGALDCIWPVGLRGRDDTGYSFPRGTSAAEQSRVFSEVIQAQIALARGQLPADRQPGIFQFTLYSEMLDKYRRGNLEVPADVILVWPDDNDGLMRALPQPGGKWKHGVYYHLAYLGPQVKQNADTVSPERITGEFRKILDAGATEYLLVNVSELREFVRETRLLADIAWNGRANLREPDPAGRYMRWFSREYFGSAAAPAAARAYADYFRLLGSYAQAFEGPERFHAIIDQLSARFTGARQQPLPGSLRAELTARDEAYRRAMPEFAQAAGQMSWAQRQYFFESLNLPLLFDWRPTQSALQLLDALAEPDDAKAFALCAAAIKPLEQLEIEILRAERPPFEQWYRHTWIRRETKAINVHRSYEELRIFLATRGAAKLVDPEPPHHPPKPSVSS